VQVLNIFTIFIFWKKLSRSAFYYLPSFSAKTLQAISFDAQLLTIYRHNEQDF
jgi:hypothetical protein